MRTFSTGVHMAPMFQPQASPVRRVWVLEMAPPEVADLLKPSLAFTYW